MKIRRKQKTLKLKRLVKKKKPSTQATKKRKKRPIKFELPNNIKEQK